jgi:hypothetical protein
MKIVESATAKLRALGITAVNPAVQEDAVVGSVEQVVQEVLPEVPPVDPSRYIKIDRLRLRAAGFLPDEAQERRFADQYRRIKRPILMHVQTLTAAH